MRRNGAWASISRKAASSPVSVLRAKPRNRIAPSAIAWRGGRTSATLSNKSAVKAAHASLRIMEDHTDGMAVAGAQPADAVTKVNAVGAARPLHRAMMHCKGHRIALA